MENSEVNRINKIMGERYGTSLDNKPFFRVVWSDSLFELRKGRFNEFSGPIFLRTVEGVKQVRKYNYIDRRWIMERWIPPEMRETNGEIINHDGYEIIYVFESKDGAPLPPVLRVCELIAYCIMNPNLEKGEKKQYIDGMLTKKFNDDVAYFEDRMEDLDNDLRWKMRYGEAILNPLQKEKSNE